MFPCFLSHLTLTDFIFYPKQIHKATEMSVVKEYQRIRERIGNNKRGIKKTEAND